MGRGVKSFGNWCLHLWMAPLVSKSPHYVHIDAHVYILGCNINVWFAFYFIDREKTTKLWGSSFRKSTKFTTKSFFLKTPDYISKTSLNTFIEFFHCIHSWKSHNPKILKIRIHGTTFLTIVFLGCHVLVNFWTDRNKMSNFGISKTNLHSLHFPINNCMLINFLTYSFHVILLSPTGNGTAAKAFIAFLYTNIWHFKAK